MYSYIIFKILYLLYCFWSISRSLATGATYTLEIRHFKRKNVNNIKWNSVDQMK